MLVAAGACTACGCRLCGRPLPSARVNGEHRRYLLRSAPTALKEAGARGVQTALSSVRHCARCRVRPHTGASTICVDSASCV
eukprot:3014445-Pleurochrysis_carterae.AAC.3